MYNDNLYFLRHLKTQSNNDGLISGRTDSRIISDKIIFEQGKSFDCIFCSTSLRCVKTAEMLNDSLAFHTDIIYTELLLERDLGFLENMPRVKAAEQYPDLFYKNKLIVFSMPPGGEPYADFLSRIKEFYKIIRKRMDSGERVLVCSHNQTLKLLYHMVLGKEITEDSWLEIEFENGVCTKII